MRPTRISVLVGGASCLSLLAFSVWGAWHRLVAERVSPVASVHVDVPAAAQQFLAPWQTGFGMLGLAGASSAGIGGAVMLGAIGYFVLVVDRMRKPD